MEQNTNDNKEVRFKSPIRYKGNLILVILCLIFLLPLGLILFMKNAEIVTESQTTYVEYHGSWGWLMFWALIFFPVAILLLVFKGIDLVQVKA